MTEKKRKDAEGEALVQRLNRNQERLDHLNRVLLGIRNVNQMIVQEDNPARLIQKACENLTETLGYHKAWIGLFKNEAWPEMDGIVAEGGMVCASALAQSGSEPVLAQTKASFEELRRRLARGEFPSCACRALENDETIIVENPRANCPDCPLPANYEGRAGMSRRLAFEGKVYGVLAVSVPTGYALDQGEQSLFEEVAGDLAYALRKIESSVQYRREQDRLKFVIEASRLGIWEWNVQTNETVFNDNWAELLGYTIAEMTPYSYETWRRLTHPEDLKRAEEGLALCVRGESPDYSCAFRMRHKDGRCIWILSRGRVITRDADGKPLRMFGTHTDITETKEAEEALRATTERLDGILSHSPLLISEIDTAGRYQVGNLALAQALGVPHSELSDKLVGEAFSPDTREIFMSRLESVAESKTPLVVEDRLETGGSQKDYVTTLFPLFDASGNVRSIGSIAQDVTEQKRAQDEVQRNAERLKALVEILQYQTESTQEFLDQALNKAIALTQSKIGYIYFYNEERKEFILNTWSKDVMKECAVVNPPSCYALDKTGIWGEAVRQRRPILINDFATGNPLKKGYPEGHVHLTRFLTVPVMRGEKIVAVVGVANKAWDYGETDVLELTLLMDAVWKTVETMRGAEALRQREEYLNAILQTTADGFWVLNGEGRVVEVNGSYCAMSGYTRDELLSLQINDLDAEEAPEETAARIRRIVKYGSEIFETRHRRKDGSVFPVEVSTTYMPEHGGRMVCFCRDLTERQMWRDRIVLLGHMLDSAPAAITIHDNEGRFLYANQATFAIHGYDREEFLKINLHDLDVPETEALLEERFRRINERGEARFEVAHYRKDGSSFPLEVNAKKIEWEGIPGVLSVATDITERKKAEEALRVSEERFRGLYENAPMAYQSLDADGRFLDVNPGWLQTLGYDRDEILGAWFGDFLHPDFRPKFLENFPKFKACGVIKGIQFQLRHKDGRYLYVEFNGCVGHHPDGGFRQTYCVFQDVTERQRAEEALRDSEALMRGILDNLQDAYFRADLSGRFNLVNPTACQMYGFGDMDELLGAPASSLYANPKEREAMLAELQANGRIKDLVLQGRRKDGSTFWVSINVQFVRDGQGKIVGTEGVVRDISDRRRAEEALEQSEARFRSIVEASPFGIYLYRLEADGRLILENGNPSADRIIGVRHANLMGKTIEEAFPNLAGTEVPEMYRKVARGELGLQNFEIPYQDARFTGYYDVHVFQTYPGFIAVEFVDITERKRAEEALRESEERFRRLVESAPMSVMMLQEGRYIYGNPAAARLLGYRSPAELAGLRALDTIAPEFRDAIAERMKRTEAGEGNPLVEIQILKADGEKIWTLTTSVPAQIQGKPTTIIVGQDITDRKRAEEALRESEQKWRNILVNTPQIGISLDLKARITFVNSYFLRTTGWTREEIIGKNWFDLFIPEEVREEIRNVFDTDVKSREMHGYSTYENEILVKSGERRNIAWSNVITNDADGRVLDITCLGVDLTERKRAEEELRRREFQLQKIFEILPIGLWFADKDGKLLRGNPAGVKIWGAEPLVSPEDYGVFKAWKLPSREPVEAGDWAIVKSIRDKATIVDELLEIESFDGQRKTILNYTAPLLDERDEVEGIIVVNLDISDRKRAEEEREKLLEQLNQAQKMESVGRLAGGVAHDFNNMLNVILGHAELLLDDAPEGHPMRSDLEEISKAAQRSADLTRQLLAFARKQTVAPKVLDLNDTIESMLKMLRRLIGEDIDLLWKPGDALSPIRMDPTQLDQTLANLVVNARDAIGLNVGKITIETGRASFDEEYCATHAGYAPGDYVMLAVGDNGCGMDAETLSHLFEPFFTTKALGKGTGLGLATVYGVVKQNEGFINVYSELGQGTSFRIYLPVYRAEKSDREAGGAAGAAPERGNETILLVEDEPAILAMTTKMLTRLGYRVLAASTPGEAIRLAEQHAGQLHMLMTDVVMPEMNGRDLAKRLLALYPGLKRLFMSGYTADVIAHQGVLDEGVNFIQKPFAMRDLSQMVRAALDS